MANFNITFLAFFFLSCLVTTFHASVLETQEFWEVQNKSVDEYWKQRAKMAEKANAKAAFADPYEVSASLTSNVHEILGGNNTRAERILTAKKGKGPCEAFNPIDRCWRCDPKWAKHRQRLAKCVKGFGRKTRGGRSGKIYVVTDSSDNDMVNPKAGTLRHAVIQAEPLWIIFSHSMVIRLRQELIMTSDKTIDGRGANVHIAGGAGITIQFIENVIIHGIHIHDIKPKIGGLIRDSVDHFGIRTRSDGDAISIFGSNRVWIDHCSLYKATDGLIDAIMGSTAITISNNHFAKHNEVMLFGASDSHTGDKKMQITVAFNNFGKGLTQRMPRCRLGFFHVVNNYYTHWKMYAIGGSQNPIIVSEGNRYIAPDDQNAKQVTMRVYTQESVWKNWQWRSINDQFVNGAYFEQSGAPVIRKKLVSKLDMITAHPVTWINRLTRNAGTLKCKVGKPC